MVDAAPRLLQDASPVPGFGRLVFGLVAAFIVAVFTLRAMTGGPDVPTTAPVFVAWSTGVAIAIILAGVFVVALVLAAIKAGRAGWVRLALVVAFGLLIAAPLAAVMVHVMPPSRVPLLAFPAGLIMAFLLRGPRTLPWVGLVATSAAAAFIATISGLIGAIILATWFAWYDAWAVRRRRMQVFASAAVATELPLFAPTRPVRADADGLEDGDDRLLFGLGDILLPTVVAVAAWNEAGVVAAAGTMAGALAGVLFLRRRSVLWRVQAGLPALIGGAVAGLLIAGFL